MSSDAATRASQEVARRFSVFNAVIWTLGLVIAFFAFVVFEDDGALSIDEGGANDDYSYEPWTNPDPTEASAQGDGRYEGDDGDVIRLSGLDVTQPIILTPDEDSYLSGVNVTGPGGEVTVRGEYGNPPEFDVGVGRSIVIVVDRPDVELWVDGLSDERWAATLSFGGIPDATPVMAGYDEGRFLYEGEATTARVSARGDSGITIWATSALGSEEVLYGDAPIDQSIAWPDTDRVVLSVDGYSDTGWRIELPTDAGVPTPGVTPIPDSSPTVTP